jgi:predicted MFS family arabinose efflux permease
MVWIAFGLGSTFGPALLGAIAKRIGNKTAHCLLLVMLGLLMLLLSRDLNLAALFFVGLAAGGSITAIVALVSSRTHELTAYPATQRQAWSACTVTFALCQALAAYAYSYFLKSKIDTYPEMFLVSAVPILLALIIEAGQSIRHYSSCKKYGA